MHRKIACVAAYLLVALTGPFLCLIDPKTFTLKGYFRFLIKPGEGMSDPL